MEQQEKINNQRSKKNRQNRRPSAFQIPKGMVKALRNAEQASVEKKFLDTQTGSSALVTWSGTTPISLTDVAQGSSDTTRVGDQLTVKRLRWKSLHVYNGGATGPTSISLLRLIVFAWKPFFADVAPTVAKIMTYTGTAYSAEAPLTHDGRDQFILLHDFIHHLDVVDGIAKLVQFDIKLDHNIHYKAGSTTNGAGGIYAFWISDSSGGAGVDPAVRSWSARIDYVDC